MRTLEIRRRVAAIVLLAVMLPMLALLSLHHHEEQQEGASSCVSCLHHVRHASHFSGGDVGLHECVLCQLQSAAYVVPSVAVLSAMALPATAVVRGRVSRCQSLAPGRASLRAPPFLC